MTKFVFAGTILVLSLAASPAFAQQGGGGGGGGRVTFAALDSDGDGIVTKEEFTANFKPPGRDGRAADPERAFGRFDADGNGEISAEEFAKRPRRQR